MKRYFVLTCCAASAGAHAYFRDDFDGNDLKSHWSIDYGEGNTNRWDYTVAGGWLDVHRLYQSNGQPGGSVQLIAGAGLFDDYDIAARVGRDAGISTLLFGIGDHPSILEAGMGVAHTPGQDPKVCAFLAGPDTICIPWTEPTNIEMRIKRHGKLVSFFLDGALVYSDYEVSHTRMGGIHLRFSGGWDDPFAPLRVDWVSAVPEPATIASLSIGFLVLALGLRRRHK